MVTKSSNMIQHKYCNFYNDLCLLEKKNNKFYNLRLQLNINVLFHFYF